MRYFYYGRGPESEERREQPEDCCGMGKAYGRGRYRRMQEGEVVIEEDTIYEIDQECESCGWKRQKRQSMMGESHVDI